MQHPGVIALNVVRAVREVRPGPSIPLGRGRLVE